MEASFIYYPFIYGHLLSTSCGPGNAKEWGATITRPLCSGLTTEGETLAKPWAFGALWGPATRPPFTASSARSSASGPGMDSWGCSRAPCPPHGTPHAGALSPHLAVSAERHAFGSGALIMCSASPSPLWPFIAPINDKPGTNGGS